MLKLLNSRTFIWTLLGGPLLALVVLWRQETLFYGEMIHLTGQWSARLTMLSLAITPLRLMFPRAGWPVWLLRRRRYFGVAAFCYAALHTVVYVDRKWDVALILSEALEFSMWSGWLALLVFAALAFTSNDMSVRTLGRAWKALHRWVYVATLLMFAHWIFSAFDFVPGLMHFAILVILEGYRLISSRIEARNAT